MKCDKCGGDVWDNREDNKKRLDKGLKARPEFSCKDKNCGWVQWTPKKEKPVPEGIKREKDELDIYSTLSSINIKLTSIYKMLELLVKEASKKAVEENTTEDINKRLDETTDWL